MADSETSPLISVVVPCFNHGHYLQQCLTSILHQTYRPIEVIVVNDGSTDPETLLILAKVNHQVVKVLNKANEGLAAARNTGIAHARGLYLLPLDADDMIEGDFLSAAVDVLQADQNVVMVSCQGRFFGTKEGPIWNRFIDHEQLLLHNTLFHASMFRKSDFERIGGYSLNMRKGYEDWDFWLRLVHRRKAVQLPQICFCYRQTGGSMLQMLNTHPKNKQDMENTLFRNNIDLYIEKWGSIIETLRQYEILKGRVDSDLLYSDQIKKSFSYRIGHFILLPLKLLKKFIS